MASCAVTGGCPTDYIAVSVSLLSIILLLTRSALPFLIHKVPRPKGSSFWLPMIQVFASFNLLLSIVLSFNFLEFRKRHWWQSCYLWAVWVEGPLGFGLLLSCRIVQAFQLYNIFVRRRLPPIRSYIFLPLILLPWIAGAAFIHMKRPLNNWCHMRTQWIIPVVCLHALYVAALVGFTGAIRHIQFRFHELKDLWRGILVSTSAIGIWVVAYILNEIHDDIKRLQVASRFLLLITASIFVLVFFSISSSQPLVSQMSLRKKDTREFATMGQALGIPDSGLLLQRESAAVIDPNELLDKLLLNKKFRQSFTAFADSCFAGESMHFYDEVNELHKIPIDDTVRRIYMARHIIEKYVVAGATMEINISYRSRQEILSTPDLTHPDLFKTALNELLYPGSHIFGNTELGDHCILMSGAVVGDDLPGHTVIGCNNVMGHHSVVGIKCQDMKYKSGDECFLEIGDNNEIREYASIHRSSKPSEKTVIGDNNLIMGSCHIAHDCKVGNNNIFANNTLLAGHVVVEDYAHTAGAIVVHQFCSIGSFSLRSWVQTLNIRLSNARDPRKIPNILHNLICDGGLLI